MYSYTGIHSSKLVSESESERVRVRERERERKRGERERERERERELQNQVNTIAQEVYQVHHRGQRMCQQPWN